MKDAKFAEWVQFVKIQAVEPMDEELSRVVMSLCFLTPAQVAELQAEPVTKDPLLQLIDSRASFLGLPLELPVLLLLAMVSKGIPGNVVIYVSYLRGIRKDNSKPLDTTELCRDIFPKGFFTAEALSRAWDHQKSSEGNYLDYFSKETL